MGLHSEQKDHKTLPLSEFRRTNINYKRPELFYNNYDEFESYLNSQKDSTFIEFEKINDEKLNKFQEVTMALNRMKNEYLKEYNKCKENFEYFYQNLLLAYKLFYKDI